jgi:hypothetical protein
MDRAATQKGKTLLKGHALMSEGHPTSRHTDLNGTPYYLYDSRSKVAHCSCGAASPEGLSIKGNQRWHREHKDALR